MRVKTKKRFQDKEKVPGTEDKDKEKVPGTFQEPFLPSSMPLRQAIERPPSLGLTLLGFVFVQNAPSLNLFHKFGFEKWAHLAAVANLDGIKRDLLILGRHVP